MRKLVKIDLGTTKIHSYCLEGLLDGHTLINRLGKKCPLKNGSFYTVLPNYYNKNYLYEFDSGILTLARKAKKLCIDANDTSMKSDWVNELFNEIKKNMNTNADSLIYENYMSEVGDPHMELYEKFGLHYQKEVHFLLKPDQMTSKHFRKVVLNAEDAWRGVGFVTSADTKSFEPMHKLTLKEIDEIIAGVKFIIFMAYDSEGRIFWKKN